MKDKCFVDTNALIYCYSDTEPYKKQRAIDVSKGENVFISTQVLNEFTNVLAKKFKLGWDVVEKSLDEITGNYLIVINYPETIKQACTIADKYHFSFYDSLIIASALEAECSFLYSEDLKHNQIIEKKLRIINPFLEII